LYGKSGLFISAVIVAAGKGTRMNMDINKMFVEVGGKPILARTVKAFQASSLIDEIVLVLNSRDIVYCKQYIVDRYGFDKVKVLAAGGQVRQESVFNGLREVDEKCDIVMIHDGARPFIREDNISDCAGAACEYGASCMAVPVKDTTKAADEEGFIIKTLDRSALWSIQTPQVFRYAQILEAHKRAAADGYCGTDDCVLAERLGGRIKLVHGSYDNIKITTREDLAIAEAIVSMDEYWRD